MSANPTVDVRYVAIYAKYVAIYAVHVRYVAIYEVCMWLYMCYI